MMLKPLVSGTSDLLNVQTVLDFLQFSSSKLESCSEQFENVFLLVKFELQITTQDNGVVLSVADEDDEIQADARKRKQKQTTNS